MLTPDDRSQSIANKGSRKSPLLRRKIELALASLSICVITAMVGAEYYLRLVEKDWKQHVVYDARLFYEGLSIASSDSVMLWEYRPNGKYVEPDGTIIRTNQFGFRDSDSLTKKIPPDTLRIAFIGDSVTLGVRVDSDATFVGKLQQLVDTRPTSHKIECLNFGIDGYDTRQIERLLSQRVMAFSPDIVVYIMCPNDFDFDESNRDKLRYFQKPTSYTWNYVSRALTRRRGEDYYDFHYKKNSRVVFAAIANMSRVVKAGSGEFMVVVLPVFDPSAKDFANYKWHGTHTATLSELNALNISAIDRLDSFRNANLPPNKLASDAWHPYANGHALIAEKLHEALQKQINLSEIKTAS